MKLALFAIVFLLLTEAEAKGRSGGRGSRRKPRPRNFMKEREQSKIKLNKEEAAGRGRSRQRDLMAHLFDDYEESLRPVRNQSKSIRIDMTMSVIHVLEVNLRKFYVQMVVWIAVKWTDEYLGWDPEDYNGMESVHIKPDSLWKPDIYVYNNLVMDQEEMEREMDGFMTTHWSEELGTFVSNVSFWFPALLQFTCVLDGKNFPFDKHNCSIYYGPWSFDIRYIDMWPAEKFSYMGYFTRSEGWILVNVTQNRVLFKFRDFPHPFSLLRVDIILKRRPFYYIMNLIVPTVIITEIAIIGFFSPASSGEDRTEKVNLGLATLLAMAIMILIVAELMPTTDSYFPIIGWFFLGIIILVSGGVVVTAAIIHVQRKARYGYRVPPLARRLFFKTFAPWVFMSIPVGVLPSDYDGSCKQYKKPKFSTTGPVSNGPVSSKGKFGSEMSIHVYSSSPSQKRTSSASSRESVSKNLLESSACLMELNKILRNLKAIRELLENKEGKVKMEWEVLADILDRVLLVVFTLMLGGLGIALYIASEMED